MELSNVISQLNWRAATKSFDPDKKITAGDLEQLLEVLRLTPSSYGLQPWKFVIVKDLETRKKLKTASYDQPQVVEASDFIVFCAKTSLAQSDVDYYIKTTAEVRGISEEVLEDFKKLLSGFVSNKNTSDLVVWGAKQTYVALGNLLTACALVNIDACPMEGFDLVQYNEILGLKDLGLTATVACAIGYRGPNDKSAETKKVRFPKEEVVIEK